MTNPAPADERRALLQSALQALDDMQAKVDATERARREPIAIIGMSCRFPGGATSPEAYWDLLREGRDVVSEYPAERRAMAEAGGIDMSAFSDETTWYGGFLDQIDQFDPQFFGISPREAATMDPQQRLVLEVSWEALERAGIAPDSLAGSTTGVFVGITTNDYIQLAKAGGPAELDVYTATGGALNAAPGRVAYTLGLQGPCMAIDTACSSSLVALHQACQSLRLRESDMALTGGVNMVLLPEAFVCFNRWGMMAPDGRCKTFDAAADGFVRGEGCGMLVLKRLSDAEASGDPVLAVIRGSAVNQDGRSSGLTVPNGPAQQAVLRQALAAASIEPAEVQYFEAHGTGTTLGDPIEVEAIGAVLGRGRSDDQGLVMGSVKTNLGHLESAAGIAGVIKVVLSMQHGEIPPHLHFHERSPQIPWPRFPVLIPTELQPWPGRDGRRVAGVSGFGFSGTNAHVVLESAPARAGSPAPVEGPQLLTVSARGDVALRAQAGQLASHLADHPDLSLVDVCATLNTGRAHLTHRLGVVASGLGGLQQELAAFAAGQDRPGHAAGRAGRPRVAFLFTGQGAQYVGMGQELYATTPAFRAALDRCAAILDPLLAVPLLDVMFAEPDTDTAALLDQTAYTQPALFSLEYALAELWRSWGVTPQAFLGHSVGEYVAAVLTGVFSLDDAARLIAARARLMQALPAGGAMAAVFAPLPEVEAAIAPHPTTLAIAAVNGPAHTVISGEAAAVAAVTGAFAAGGVRVQALTVSHAFHSPLMEPMIAEFTEVARGVEYHPPRRPVVSNVTGQLIGAELAEPDYWIRHVLAPVRFADGIMALHADGIDTFLEIGPHPVLVGMAQASLPPGAATWVPSLRRNREDQAQLLDGLAALYVAGVTPDWTGITPPHRRMALPTYPFQRQHHWLDPVRRRRVDVGGHPLLGSSTHIPVLNATVHEAEIAPDAPAWLADHRLSGTVVFPGSAYVEMVLASTGAGQIETLAIREALVLADDSPHDEAVTLQTVVVTAADGAREVQIVSLAPDQPDGGRVHVRAAVPLQNEQLPPGALDVAGLDDAFPAPIDVGAYYEQLDTIGLTYGPTFQGLTRLLRRDGAAAGLAALPADVADGARYHLHPALLDACFHVLGVAMAPMSESNLDDLLVPVALDGLRLYRAGETSLWCVVTILSGLEGQGPTVTARLDLYGADGTPAATIERLEVRRTPRSLWQRSAPAEAGPLYDVAWRPQPRPDAVDEDRAWLVFADGTGTGEELAARLGAGSPCVSVVPGPVTGQLEPGRWQLDVDDPAGLGELCARALDDTAALGIVYLWGLDVTAEPVGLAELGADVDHSLHGALHVSQYLAEHPTGDARLWFVTRGAQSPEGEPASAAQATLWGLGRVLANEQPSLRCVCIDLDPANGVEQIDELAAELAVIGDEDQVALRSRRRSVARLARFDAANHAAPGAPYQLDLADRGSLEHLTYAPAERRAPGPEEVEVEVRTTGINFRDVLNTLGMYPGDPGPPGLECAGVVVAVGNGVSELAVGDEVVGIAPRAFDSHVVTAATLMVRKPETLTFAEAATIPIAFLTAAYGLRQLADLQAGERVLIHAAAGGVGMAAVDIAQRAGAEIYATVGSAEKRERLAALGVRHIYSSRTLEFAEQILADTGGAGVDVVLNSLSDDFIDSSFAVLAPQGRFLEIGKRGIWTAAQVAAVRPEAAYHPYDLADFLLADPEDVHASLQAVIDDMAAGGAAPLPLRAFPAEAIEDAFRYMAQARHIGKVVLTHAPHSPTIRPAGGYLITGGLGGLGLTVAQWLIDEGARDITLTGRQAPSATAMEAIAAMERDGVRVQVVQADVADPVDVERVLAALEKSGTPLRGVFHAAGIVDDGALAQQTWPRFEGVLAPKVTGAWLLDQATRTLDLDHFVLFSSASAILGAPGQSSYAAANSAMDALARRRRAEGLPGLSINWGAWADVGMAARLDERDQRRIAARGIGTLAATSALDALALLLDGSAAQVAVVPIDWPTLVGQLEVASGVPPLLSELAGGLPRPQAHGSASSDQRLTLTLAAADPPVQRDIVNAYVREQIVRVLGLDPAEAIEPHQGLTELGMDSLMAVELSNRLRVGTALALPSTLAFEYPTLTELTDFLAEELLGPTPEPAGVPRADGAGALQEISDEDVADQLLKELEESGY